MGRDGLSQQQRHLLSLRDDLDVPFDVGRALSRAQIRREALLEAAEEAIKVVTEDFRRGGSVENITALVIRAALVRILALADAEAAP